MNISGTKTNISSKEDKSEVSHIGSIHLQFMEALHWEKNSLNEGISVSYLVSAANALCGRLETKPQQIKN